MPKTAAARKPRKAEVIPIYRPGEEFRVDISHIDATMLLTVHKVEDVGGEMHVWLIRSGGTAYRLPASRIVGRHTPADEEAGEGGAA